MSDRAAKRRGTKRWISVGSYFATLLLTCASLSHFLPEPEVPVVQEKLAQFAAQRDSYDTVFIGSSHFYFQIVPSVFDEVTAAGGLPTHSFNLGLAGLRPPEDGYLLERILALRPRNLRYVFVELGILRTRVEHPDTARAVYWHDLRRTELLWRATARQIRLKNLWSRPEKVWEPMHDFLLHFLLFARRQSNVGRADFLLGRFGLRERSEKETAILGEARDGWIAANMPQQMTGENLARYEKGLRERQIDAPRKHAGDEISRSALQRILDCVERAGAIAVLVVPPTLDEKNFTPSVGGPPPYLFDFCSPRDFPEFYRSSHRLDPTHLNTAGARLFSRILAERFLAAHSRAR